MEDTILRLHVTPRSSRNEIIGFKEDVLYIKITAPPVDGSANSAIIKFLAESLKIKKNQIELISGEKSREKRVRISMLSKSKVLSILSKQH
ncbi:MAG: DUF167 domain-containing protein [Armatimonadota bacterium]